MINESLNNENRKKFRELVKMFHPDINKDQNQDSKIKMYRLNSVKDDDKKFEDFYNEVMKIKLERPSMSASNKDWYDWIKSDLQSKKEQEKPKESDETKTRRPSIFKTDKEWHDWMEKVKKRRLKTQEEERKRQRK